MSDGPTEFQREFDVSRETMERLEVYADLLKRWNKKINLVSPKSLENLWARHFSDSAQLFSVFPREGEILADLGSGAGFPGAVIAITANEIRPELQVSLIESDQRKASFLEVVSRETGSPFRVISERVERIERFNANILTARALAPLSKLLEYAILHGAPGFRAIFPKGANVEREVQGALEVWRFDCKTFPSRTDPGGVILSIGDIERA